MKRSGTVLIFVIVWAAVLFASFVIGICIKEVRFHRAGAVIETKTDTKPKVSSKVEKLSDAEKLAQELTRKSPMPRAGGVGGISNRPGGQGPKEAGGNMMERLANMSEEERAQMMRERMGGRRREGGMRERMQNMSEEEREAYRAQMRERMGGRRPQGGGEGGRGRPGGRPNGEQQENN